MRRFLTSLVLFCLLCGGGLMLLGSRFGAERTIEVTTDDGYNLEISLFDGSGFSLHGVSVNGREFPDVPEIPDIPTPPRPPAVESAASVNGDLSGKSFAELTVYASVGEITIQSGADWSVSLDGLDSFYEAYDGCLEVNAGMGNAVVTVPQGTWLDYLSLEGSAGKITLDGIQTEYLDIDQSMGETVLRNCSWSSADIDSDCGSIKGTGLISECLDVSADMGEISLQGALTGETDVEANAGSVSLELTGRQDDYDIELESELGGVTLNGRSSGRAVSQSGGPHSLEVSCDVGSIEVRFDS